VDARRPARELRDLPARDARRGCRPHRHSGRQPSRPELDELSARLKAAGNTTFDEEATTCCYAQSDKSWVADPAGVRWETFYTFGQATTYGEDISAKELAAKSACAGAACGTPAPAESQAKASASCCG
jgi:hypothetical protein